MEDKVYTLESNPFVKLLFEAYPFLKKRADENPEPALVKVVTQIEQLDKTIRGEQ